MNRFRITKIGLLNFWLYDEEEYDFYGGKIILRGSNGSGKSVTMQSFIPLILDGNKSPDRLDPFGSKERKIEDYILGDSETIQKDEAISYLYMETYNKELNKYITVGLGFRGRKGKPTESWGFCLKDGMRIGKDLFLYKDAANKIPITKNELKSRLGSINEFTITTRDYKAMVNKALFGFPNLDTYDEFIKLLLQLRSNKLSKDYKPTNLVSVLNTVLQPLTEEDLRPLSEAIEQMNKTKEQVENLEKNIKSLNDFLKVYQRYNEVILQIKAKNYYNNNISYNELLTKIKEETKILEENKNLLQKSNERYQKIISEIIINKENKKQLDNQDLKQKIESLNSILDNINNLENKLKEINNNISKSEEEILSINNKINNIENDLYHLKKRIDESCLDLKNLSNESYFDEISFFIDELQDNNNKNFSFQSIFISLKSYTDKVLIILKLLEEEQKILLESETLRVEYEKLTISYKKTEQDISNQEKNLQESIMAWEEEFINNLNSNKHLKLDDHTKKKIFDLMNNYSSNNYNLSRNIYIDYSRDMIDTLKEKEISLNNKKEHIQKTILDLKDEYQLINNKDTLELPPINEDTDKILLENNITNIALYKCLEFKKELSDNTKNKIESSLLSLNILNAKIINPKDITKVESLEKPILYLKKTTKKKNNLLKYFNITLEDNINISENTIKEVLESISIDKNDLVAILDNGKAQIDALSLIPDSNYNQMYIGYLKRKELKEQKLIKIKKEIETLESELNNINKLITNIIDKKKQINEESQNFPSNNFLIEIIENINKLTIALEYNDKRQKELESSLNITNKKLTEIKENISSKKQGLYIPLNLETYKEVSNLLYSIKETLQDLKNTYDSYINKQEIKENLKERVESETDNVDYLKTEKLEKERNLEVNINTRNNINELLETKKYKDQKEQLINIEKNLKELEQEKEELIAKKSRLEKDIEYKENTLNTLKLSEEKLERKNQLYTEIFLREYKLNYIYQEEIIDIDKTARKILKDEKNKKDISLNDALNNFYSSFNHYSLELNDYCLKNITLFTDYNSTLEDERKIYEENTRVDVVAMYQGIKINILELSKKLTSDIEENKLLISEQDRHLFEDILLNTVGDKIRKRIESSNEWVAKINNIMSKMQENSALSFKLVWKSITAETDQEIDTKELVRILKMPPNLLKDEDKENLTNHFRAKIKKGEELYQDSFISFYKIIEEVLDYRNWFTFQLLYQRKGTNYKELTDKTFSKFSGGERAKSMYIPLFASCYAKLNIARPDALRIIALDEAFAGVDEDNIREMFGILKYLDIDFIINSQVLWGDYDTIDDLSICELIRPQNSQVVTVERYRWNGNFKEIINNRTEYNKEIENA